MRENKIHSRVWPFHYIVPFSSILYYSLRKVREVQCEVLYGVWDGKGPQRTKRWHKDMTVAR
jgi:hypothetical protein